MTQARVVRIGFGTSLVAALTLLYLSACQLLQGPGLPIWIEGMVLWGPTTLAVCGAAVLTDRWLARRRDSGSASASGWFVRNEFCLFVDEQPGPVAGLKVHVTGALTVA